MRLAYPIPKNLKDLMGHSKIEDVVAGVVNYFFIASCRLEKLNAK